MNEFINNLYLFNMKNDSFLQKDTNMDGPRSYFWNNTFMVPNESCINIAITMRGFYYLTMSEKYRNYYDKEDENILNAVYSYCFYLHENYNQILLVPHKNFPLNKNPDFTRSFKL